VLLEGSLCAVPPAAMELVASAPVPLELDALQQALLGMDCDDSAFGRKLCARLGYQQVSAGRWHGNETSGLLRDVTLVVKLPPKPMFPDVTRVHIRHRLLRLSQDLLLLEREVASLDVPYGDTFRVQERWLGAAAPQAGAVRLHVLSHVNFRGRGGLMAGKIRQKSIKTSRKVANLAVELLVQTQSDDSASQGSAALDSSGDSSPLQEQYAALLEEAAYFKRRTAELERENRRLQAASSHSKKGRRQLLGTIAALEQQLAKERFERAAMEETLTTAYNTMLRELVEGAAAAERGASGSASKSISSSATPARSLRTKLRTASNPHPHS